MTNLVSPALTADSPFASGAHPDMRSQLCHLARDLSTLLVAHMNLFVRTDDNPFGPVDEFPDGHKGAAPVKIDEYLSRVARQAVLLERYQHRAMSGITLFQEEVVESRVSSGDKNRVRVVVDPLDGSKIFAAFGVGAVSVLVYCDRRGLGRWELIAGAVALRTGEVFTYKVLSRRLQPSNGSHVAADVEARLFDAFTRVAQDDFSEPADLGAIDLDARPRAGLPQVLLVSSAASPSRRAAVAAIVGDLGLEAKFEGTFAGNLAVWGAALGTTSVIIDPSPATMHDGNYLVILSAMGWTILDAETRKPVDILVLAESDCSSRIAHEARIPAIVAFRDADALDLVRG